MGNAGTIDGTNFIGTTDNIALNFRMNNEPAGRIEGSTNANTCFGYRSGNLPGGSGVKNTAFGYFALQANTTGRENVATGYNALKANTAGYYNTANGFSALETNTTASYNTATGYASLANNTTGGSNTATGASALFYNVSGYLNTAAGYFAMNGNVSGAQNTSTGVYSLVVNGSGSNNVADGYASLVVNSSGSQNVAIGANALFTNTTGSNNTGLGYYANVSTNNLGNATAIGANAVVNASNKVRIGSPAVTVVEGPVAYTISDGRFKTDIAEDDVKGLDFIQRLRPVVYNMDTRKFQEFLTQSMADSVRAQYLGQDFAPSSSIRQSGFIAQEVEQAAKETGYDFNGVHVPQDENDNYSLAYSQFVVPLVKGMQEQQAMIEAQNAALAQQQAQIEALQKLVAAMAAAPADKSGASAIATPDAVAVYPNPTQGTFTVYTQTIDQGRIEISDVKGSIIYAADLVKGTFAYPVDLSTQVKGIFVVSVRAGEKVISKKLVLE
jgi:trimeric autotransporter adhesin